MRRGVLMLDEVDLLLHPLKVRLGVRVRVRVRVRVMMSRLRTLSVAKVPPECEIISTLVFVKLYEVLSGSGLGVRVRVRARVTRARARFRVSARVGLDEIVGSAQNNDRT